MPLFGYLKTSDRSRISTITVDNNKERRKRLEVTRNDSASSRGMMYVRDCIAHDSGESIGGLVPVQLMERDGDGWAPVAVVKCCVLCWRIVDPNWDTPTPQPVVLTKGHVGDGSLTAAKKARAQAKRQARKSAAPKLTDRLAEFLSGRPMEWWTTADLVTTIGSPRQSIIRALQPLIESGRVEVERGGHGKGNSTQYSWKDA